MGSSIGSFSDRNLGVLSTTTLIPEPACYQLIQLTSSSIFSPSVLVVLWPGPRQYPWAVHVIIDTFLTRYVVMPKSHCFQAVTWAYWSLQQGLLFILIHQNTLTALPCRDHAALSPPGKYGKHFQNIVMVARHHNGDIFMINTVCRRRSNKE